MILTINGLIAGYNNNKILEAPSIKIPEGTITLIKGLNGSGKSTLLRTINLLIPPIKGEILFRDKFNDKNLLRKNTIMLGQHPYIFRDTVYNNLVFGLKSDRIDKSIIKSKANMWLEKMGLTELIKKNAYQLSGGELQRLSLARTFIVDRSVYILDEPDSMLDVNYIAILNEIILDIKSAGYSVLLTTHKQDFMEKEADLLIKIENGLVQIL